MAHMQLEVEKQLRKKSPIAEIVSVQIPIVSVAMEMQGFRSKATFLFGSNHVKILV